MKIYKRVLACMLALTLAVSNVAVAATEAETNAANQLHAYEIYKGRDNGDLALDSTITRAEIATLVLRITAQENDEPYTPQFKMTQKDVAGHWAEKNIRKVIELGYMKGYDENTFGPNDKISYAEVVTLMLRLVGQEKDIKGDWPVGQIDKAKSIGLIKGETIVDKSKYSDKLNRGTVALIIFDAMTMSTNVA